MNKMNFIYYLCFQIYIFFFALFFSAAPPWIGFGTLCCWPVMDTSLFCSTNYSYVREIGKLYGAKNQFETSNICSPMEIEHTHYQAMPHTSVSSVQNVCQRALGAVVIQTSLTYSLTVLKKSDCLRRWFARTIQSYLQITQPGRSTLNFCTNISG
jgi:hypothetical protein